MITGEKLRNLYYQTNEENIVTTKDLKEVGLWEADIKKLVDQQKIYKNRQNDNPITLSLKLKP